MPKDLQRPGHESIQIPIRLPSPSTRDTPGDKGGWLVCLNIQAHKAPAGVGGWGGVDYSVGHMIKHAWGSHDKHIGRWGG